LTHLFVRFSLTIHYTHFVPLHSSFVSRVFLFNWIKTNGTERNACLIQLNETTQRERMEWADMEVPSESFCRSSWDSRTCYPWRTTNQGLTDDEWVVVRLVVGVRVLYVYDSCITVYDLLLSLYIKSICSKSNTRLSLRDKVNSSL